MKRFAVLLCVLTASAALASDSREEWGFKTVAAKTAMRGYDRDVEQARAAYEHELDLAQRELIADLRGVRDRMIRGGNPGEAVRLEKAIEHYTSRYGVDDDSSWPTGSWRVVFTQSDWQFGYRFDGDNTAQRIGPAGELLKTMKMVRRNGHFLILYDQDQRLERITFCGEDLMFVEHFNPKSSYPNGAPEEMGRGTRIKQQQ